MNQELTPQQRGAMTRAENNGGVHPGGRTPLYDPAYCDTVIELGLEGKSIAQMASHIGVAKSTVFGWVDVHTEFATALTLAKTHAQCWWENQAGTNLENRDFNGNLWNKCVSSRFRDDYTPRQEHTGKDGAPIEMRDTESARRIAYMLGKAVGRQETETVDEPKS